MFNNHPNKTQVFYHGRSYGYETVETSGIYRIALQSLKEIDQWISKCKHT